MVEPRDEPELRGGSTRQRGELCRRLHLLPFIALLSPGIGLYVGFWLQSSPIHATAAGILIDSLLAGGSIVLALSLLILVTARATDRRRIAVVASGVAALPGVVVCTAAFGVLSPSWPVVLLGAAATAASGAALVILGVFRQLARPHGTRSLVAVAAFLAVPLFSFWQQLAYLPDQSQPSLTTTLDAKVEAEPSGAQHWVVSISESNSSNVRATVGLTPLDICAAAREGGPTQERRCTSFRPFADGSFIDPNATVVAYESVGVDPARPYIDVEGGVSYARGDRFRTELPLSTLSKLTACDQAPYVPLKEDARYKAMVNEQFVFGYYRVGDRRAANIQEGSQGLCRANPDPDTSTQAPNQAALDYYSFTKSIVHWKGWAGAPNPTSAPTRPS